MRLRRTGVGALALVSLTLPLAVPGAAAAAEKTTQVRAAAPADTLRAAARGTDIKIGTAVDMASLGTEQQYTDLVAAEFSTVTAENVMKWEVTEPQQGVHQWAEADRLVDFARANNQKVRGHTLVWHSQNPAWANEQDFSAAELRKILKQHIIDEVTHFKGKIWHWDVVNEIFNDDGTWRDSIWLRNLGRGYVADAFRWAHQADPKAKLYVNDYNNEGISPKSDAYYNLIKQLKADGVPVHGYGIQGHLALQYTWPTDTLQNLQRFETLGLDSAFTEVDVRMILPEDTAKVQAQAQGFTMLLQACLLAKRCQSYTLWGFTDAHSWVPGVFAGEGQATPLDVNYVRKPAYHAIRDTLLLAGQK